MLTLYHFSIYTGTECCERLAYYGIATNLVSYLTTKLHESNVSAARNVTTWSGTCYLTPLIGAVLADAYWGRYWTIAVFSTIYFIVSSGFLFFCLLLQFYSFSFCYILYIYSLPASVLSNFILIKLCGLLYLKSGLSPATYHNNLFLHTVMI